MGDHARREMIVRTTQVARQNPAYRPIANNPATSDGVSSEVVCFHSVRINVDNVRRKSSWLLLVYAMIACSSSPRVLPPPTLPPTLITSPSAAWTFNHAPGTSHYQISRSAAIETRTDSTSQREVTTNTTSELITLAPVRDSGVEFTAVIDAFSTTTQGLIGPVQPIRVPVQLSGVVAQDSLTISNDAADRCNPVSSALLSDLHNLLIQFPARISRGQVWRDSLVVSGCQAAVPTALRTTRSYVVLGEALFENRPVVLIQRSDTIHAHGEGAQQQHRLILDAEGTGNAVYFLDTKNGQIVRLTTGQELNLTITTSSKPYRFKQSSRQDFRLTR
jgi:hypothetical protein